MNTCTEPTISLRDPPPPLSIMVDIDVTRDKLFQTFPFCFCVLEVIKNWMVGRPSNEAIPFSYFDLSVNKLTLDDLGQVIEEVLDVSAQWYHLGLQLKVRTGTLDRIRTQFSDPRDQLLEMVKTWLTTSDNTSWRTLMDALRSRSVGASQLASILKTKYCLGEETEIDSGPSTSDIHPESVVNPSPFFEQIVFLQQPAMVPVQESFNCE